MAYTDDAKAKAEAAKKQADPDLMKLVDKIRPTEEEQKMADKIVQESLKKMNGGS